MTSPRADRGGQSSQTLRPHVLIVDDEPHIVEFLQMGFDYEGFDVVVAKNGTEALTKAAAHPPDIVILDVMLP
ncbi:MAG: response regulator, partial [Burkholderiales bacterium]